MTALGLAPRALRTGNTSVLYLLVVFAAALRFGSRPAMAASVFTVTAFHASEGLALGCSSLRDGHGCPRSPQNPG